MAKPTAPSKATNGNQTSSSTSKGDTRHHRKRIPPAHTVEPEAISRLGENLDTDIVDTSGKINAVVALRSPLDLHNCRSHDQVDNLLSGGIQLEYALYTGTSHDEYNRFPQQGFIPGTSKTSQHSAATPPSPKTPYRPLSTPSLEASAHPLPSSAKRAK